MFSFHAPTLTLSNGRYRVHTQREPLGQGSYSTVYDAEPFPAPAQADPTTPTLSYVAKVLDLATPQRQRAFEDEKQVFALLAQAPHPNIIRCVDHYIINNHGVLILERFKGLTLEDHLEKHGALGIDAAVHCLRQIVSALRHLHDRNIAVRDLKPENIAFDPQTGAVQLFDFGLASVLPTSGTRLKDSKGSPMFMPPEMLHTEWHDPLLGDVWALGQTVYYMLTGHSMFCACRNLDILRYRVNLCAFAKGFDAYLDGKGLSCSSKTLIRGLCAYAPALRWTLEHVHVWIQTYEKTRAAPGGVLSSQRLE